MKNNTYYHDDEFYYNLIRKNLKRIRQDRNLTQQDLADMTNISRQYICDVENESRYKHITISYLGRIADVLNTDITKFFKTK